MSKETDRPLVVLYTDGACSPNPGVGSWAAVLVSPGHEDRARELSGAEAESTNNRMEMTAAIQGLRALKRPCEVELYTDSQYLKKGFTEGWLESWRQNGWRTRGKKAVANVDLWKELDELSRVHRIQWHWVRAHADDPINVRCDALAVAAREELAQTLA